MGPYVGVDNNLTVCRCQSRLQQIYHGQTYDKVDLSLYYRVDFIPQSGTGFGLCIQHRQAGLQVEMFANSMWTKIFFQLSLSVQDF
jgi:hypothetical protein